MIFYFKRLKKITTNNYVQWNIFRVLFFLITVVLVFIVNHCFRYEYIANDDFGNIYCLREQLQSPFMGYVFSKILNYFYANFSSYPWYGLALQLSLGIGCGLLVCLSLKYKTKCQLALSFAFAAYIYSFQYQTFTVNAILLSSVGTIFYFLSAKQVLFTLDTVVLLLCYFIAYGVRREGAIFGVFLAVGLYLARQIPTKKEDLYIVLKILIAIIIFSSVMSIDYMVSSYESERYKDYIEYNSIRGKLHGFGNENKETYLSSILKDNSWTSVDYKNFFEFKFYSESKFSKIKLANLLRHTQNSRWFDFSLDALVSVLGRDKIVVATCVGLTFVLFASGCISISQGNRYLCVLAFVLIFFSSFLRFPFSLALPTYVFYIIFLLFFSMHKGASDVKNPYPLFLFGLSMCFVFSYMYKSVQARPRSAADVKRVVEYVNSKYSHSLIIGGAFYVDNYTEAYVKVLPPGWMTFSPLYYKILRSHGFESGDDFLNKLGASNIVFMSKKNWKYEVVEWLLPESLLLDLQTVEDVDMYAISRFTLR